MDDPPSSPDGADGNLQAPTTPPLPDPSLENSPDDLSPDDLETNRLDSSDAIQPTPSRRQALKCYESIEAFCHKNLCLVASTIVVLVLAVVVSVAATWICNDPRHCSTPALTPAPTQAPIRAPIRAPGTLERESMITFIQSKSASTSFSNSTPQTQALEWILADKYSSEGLSDSRLLQRFALATLYYSTSGTEWRNGGGGWLTSRNECEWGGSDKLQFGCSQESMVQRLYLQYGKLSGLIPIETGLLTQLN